MYMHNLCICAYMEDDSYISKTSICVCVCVRIYRRCISYISKYLEDGFCICTTYFQNTSSIYAQHICAYIFFRTCAYIEDGSRICETSIYIHIYVHIRKMDSVYAQHTYMKYDFHICVIMCFTYTEDGYTHIYMEYIFHIYAHISKPFSIYVQHMYMEDGFSHLLVVFILLHYLFNIFFECRLHKY